MPRSDPAPADLLVTGARVVTVDGQGPGPLRGAAMARPEMHADGAVAAHRGTIVAVGPESRVRRRIALHSDATIVEAGDRLVMPGLIDPHTHLVFHGWRAGELIMRLQGRTYAEILAAGGGILDTVRHTRSAADTELLAAGCRHLDGLLLNGVTTVEVKSGYGLSTDQELRLLRLAGGLGDSHEADVVPTFLGAHAVPPECAGRGDEYVNLVTNAMLPAVAGEGLARFCDVFCEPEVFNIAQTRSILQRARSLGLECKLHADELEGSGGAELAVEAGCVSADHLLRISDQGIAALAGSETIAVLLPATAFFLMSPVYAPARRLIDAGAAVALATDFNPGTSPTLSPGLVTTIATLNMGMTPAETLVAWTRNAACALGLGHRIGRLAPGLQADIVILDAPGWEYVPYRLGARLVETVIKRGRVVVSGGRLAASNGE